MEIRKKHYKKLILNIGIFILFLGIFFSCTEQRPTFKNDFRIINKLLFPIEIHLFRNGEFQDKIYLIPNGKREFSSWSEGSQLNPPPFLSDSALFIYNDTTIITHYRIDYSIPKHNIHRSSDWDLRMNSDSHYIYSFNIDEEDYNEAIEQQ